MKILMVCLGNICRSPLAEGIMQKMINDHNLPWEVDSAGTGAWHIGESPDPRSQKVAMQNGLDISHQRARQFHAGDFDTFDYIIVMDSSNYRNVSQLARNEADMEKVELIMNFVQPGYNQAVPDPYYAQDGFGEVYEMLIEACDAFIKTVTS
ncbi:MAG: low molecular weight protein-tyrosine-phosphatase [Bacteroidota bacterium]